jgi:hypothetical protein
LISPPACADYWRRYCSDYFLSFLRFSFLSLIAARYIDY